MVEMSDENMDYFAKIQKAVDSCYEIAEYARQKGLDPENYVESPQAKDLAGRVEKLVGPEGIADFIRDLKFQGKSEDQIVFNAVLAILDQKVGNLKSLEERVERAIRVGLAIKTMGVVSAPLEGISKIEIRNDQQNNKYLSLYFAGPIRAAGGTTAALCILIADYVRSKSQIPKYRATEAEIGRYVEEVKLYDRRVHLQYPSSNDEIRFAVEHLPVEINGDSTEDEEVSAFRNLPRIETNNIRGGACLVLNDGILLKAPKLLKIAESMNISGWEWLADLKKIAQKADDSKEVKEKKEKLKIIPNSKFVSDIIAGRPVFSHPSQVGGHRIRYGRSRNTGLAAAGIHPATMAILDDFIAIGTQLRIERPGKSASMCPVSSLEPPVVLLKNGDVLRVPNANVAKKLFPNIKKVLYLGDILFGFGEFAENNHVLVPSGYVEEWWALELEKSMNIQQKHELEFYKYIEDPFKNIPSYTEALKLGLEYKIPLHPFYTDYWGNITSKELKILRKALLDGYNKEENNIILKNNEEIKEILEKAFVSHIVKEENIIIGPERKEVFKTIFNLENTTNVEIDENLDIFRNFSNLSPLKIRNKAPYYMGTRMGRPEKSERKSMKGVHGLFPLSDKVGNSRLVEKAIELGKIKIDICRKKCPKCGEITPLNICSKCRTHTEFQKICSKCNKVYPKYEVKCTQCGQELSFSNEARFDIKGYVNSALERLKISLPDKLKGIIGLTNQFKVPEPIEKGILRAKNGLLVYKTAETRYDATDIPLTHFKPKEIGTSLTQLKELGYTHDYKGKQLVKENQIIELKVQDVLLSDDCAEYFIKLATFLDDELDLVYNMDRFYNIKKKEDLIGHLVVGLAPHTSAGIIGRIIGFSSARSIYAHPFWHAAKRRNCLSGSEEILIWDSKKKELLIEKIGDIIEEMIKRGAKREIIDDFGTFSIENLHPEWQIVSIDPDSKKQIFQPIKNWIKGTSNFWINISTFSGREMSMTYNHKTLIWDFENNSIKKVKACNLRERDNVPIIMKVSIPKLNPKEFINIAEELSNKLPNSPKFESFKNNLRLRGASEWIHQKLINFAKMKGFIVGNKPYKRLQPLARKLIINMLPNKPFKAPLTSKWYNSIPLNHLEALNQMGVFDWNDIPKEAKLGMARDDLSINLYLPFNSNLMRILGYYIAEGYIRDQKSCYQINFSAPNPILRRHIKNLIVNVFDKKPYFKEDNFQLIHSGRIHAYLFAYAWRLGCNAYSKRLPNFIYSLPKKYQLELLSAYIDGDGSIPKTDDVVLLYSVSKTLLNNINVLLNIMGILARPRKPTPKGHFGKKVLARYRELGKKPKDSVVHRIAIRGCDLSILKDLHLTVPSKIENAKRILEKGYYQDYKVKRKDGSFSLLKKVENILLDPIDKIRVENSFKSCYCLEVETGFKNNLYHNLSTTVCLTSNCDGDEDGIMLLLDPLLNFSRYYLPSKIGGRMDATLVISSILDPNEIDVEAHNIDTLYQYPLEFYEATQRYAVPSEVETMMRLIKSRLGTVEQYENIGFNIPTRNINEGPTTTAYKTYESMDDKIDAQLHLAKIIKSVDAKKVAEKILSTHFNPDILGNLRKFAVQKFRCVKCNEKFRRPPLSNAGKCPKCGNNVILTVNRGGIEKYISRAVKLCDEFNLDEYTKQRMTLIEEYVESLTNNPRIKQQKLSDFF